METNLFYILAFLANGNNYNSFWYIKTATTGLWTATSNLNRKLLPTPLDIFEVKIVLTREKETRNYTYMVIPTTSTPIQIID